jgi:sensor histidine kinase regulating citrate/malate metabolism
MAGRDRPVARQVLLWQAFVVAVLVVSASALAVYDAERDARRDAVDRSVAVARSVADSPTVVEALAGPDPSATLQPYAERVRADTGVDFITIMGLDRIRFTHPDPAQIGRRFVGDVGDAPQGGTLTQEYTGTLGPSMRAVVPIRATPDGPVRAMVAVGITIRSIRGRLVHAFGVILAAGLLSMAAGVGGAWLVSRRLRRQTRGLGARELARMYEYHSAVLHAVQEGLVLLDERGRVQLVNDEARRLLDLPADVEGLPFGDLGLPPALVEAVAGEHTQADSLYVAGDKVLVVNSSPARWEGRDVGAVVTLRDRTELQAVTGELDVVRGLADALQAQGHEAANRLHTVVSLIEMGRAEEAVDLATRELAVAQELVDRVVGAVEDPVVAALVLGKSAEAAQRGLVLVVDGAVTEDACPVDARDLVTVIGNLVDNAFDAAAAGSGDNRVQLDLEWDSARCAITVGDPGPGVPEADVDRVLERGWSTKATAGSAGRGLGLALVAQVARRHHGEVRIGRSALGGAEVTVTLQAPAAGAAGRSRRDPVAGDRTGA